MWRCVLSCVEPLCGTLQFSNIVHPPVGLESTNYDLSEEYN